MERIIGVDPGSESHGVCIIEEGRIVASFQAHTDQFFDKVTKYLLQGNNTVVIEDLAAYSLRLTPQVIDTAKFIGTAVERLKTAVPCIIELIPRSAVKKWVFDEFELAKVLCKAKVDKAVLAGKYAERAASFVYVDDRIVTECMKECWGIKKPSAGKGYEFGLKDHGWQALAVATLYLQKSRIG